MNFTNRPILTKPSFRADTQPYRVNFDMPRYSDASPIVKSLLMILPESERVPVTVQQSIAHKPGESHGTPIPHDAPARTPASDWEWTLSGCDLALKSSGLAFRVPSGLSPASAPSRLLLRRSTLVR